MNIFIPLWIFYKKLILPSLAVSILLAFFFFGAVKILSGIGIAYIFLTPVFHYLLYDLTDANQYYFYYNLGISKLLLWISSIIASLIIGLILMLI
ncbi:MAG: hypothetical protein V4663_10165 [Bacteroidota bacterium]